MVPNQHILGAQELRPMQSVEMLILAHSWTQPDHRATEGEISWAVAYESTQIHLFKTVQKHSIRPHLEVESSQGCLRPNKAVSVDLSHQD